MILLEINKKEKNKLFVYTSFVLSIIFFIWFLISLFLIPQFHKISDNITQNAILSQMSFNLYYKSNEEIKINKVDFAKNIEQYNNLADSSKPLSLLLLSGQINNNIMSLHHIDNNVVFFSRLLKDDEYMKLYKESLSKASDKDMNIYRAYLSQLVQYYNELPYQSIFGNGFIAKELDKKINPNQNMNDKILISLYSLNNTIEHWKEIKEIVSLNFSVVDFNKDKQTYWNNNFSSSYGKDIPEYIKIYYDKNSIDLNIAKEWIKNFK